MNPQNRNERKRIKSRFLLLYLVSIALLGAIFAALLPGKKQKVSDIALMGTHTMESEIIKTDFALHSQFKTLQALDEAAIELLTDSGFVNNDAGLQKQMDSLDMHIATEEEKISRSIDILNNMTKTFKGKENAADSLITAYSVALKNHRTFKNIRSLISLSLTNSGDNSEMLAKWQTELQKKDKNIAVLENQIRSLQRASRYQSEAATTNNGTEQLLKKEMDNSAYLSKVNTALKQDNDRLLMEITKVNQLSENTLKDKQSEQEKRIKDLTAELYLAQVDCNLTRADAKQVVFNSRQRKDLLAEALKVLGNLSETGDAAIKQKVKEKTDHLQYISNTIRD